MGRPLVGFFVDSPRLRRRVETLLNPLDFFLDSPELLGQFQHGAVLFDDMLLEPGESGLKVDKAILG